MEHTGSKPLEHDDSSGFAFAQEMLKGDPTSAVNMDRIQRHPEKGFIIFEYLLCEESQTVTPYTRHPRRYWHKNAQKFISLWEIAQKLEAALYLVNYAKPGTVHADEILVILVLGMDGNGITEEKTWRTNRTKFSAWFRQLNRECLRSDGL